MAERLLLRLTLHSDGKMKLETENSDITFDAGTANIIINADKRIENTNSEREHNTFGTKSEIVGGLMSEIAYGAKFEGFFGGKLEVSEALAISMAAAAVFDFNYLFKAEMSLLNWAWDQVKLSKKEAEIENSGVAVTVQKAIKMIL